MSCSRVATTIATLALCLAVGSTAQGKGPKVKVREVFVHNASVVHNSEYASRFRGANTLSFDLSPDGKTLAVELETFEEQRRQGVWVALWDVETKQLRSVKRLEGPVGEVFPHAQYGTQVRFTHDSRMLIVLTGPRFVALKLPDLEEHYAVEAPAARDDSPSRLFIYKFSIATPANRLALLYVYHRVYSASYEVKILDSKNGEVLQHWRGAGQAAHISLSAEGKRVAVSVVSGVARSDKNNVLIFDASSGDLVRILNPQYATGSLQFVGNGNQLATVARYHMVPKFYRTDTIKLWDVSTGEVLREIGYRKYGIRGALAISSNGGRLGAITEWDNPMAIRMDWSWPPGFTRFLIWALPTGESLFVSQNLRGHGLWNSADGEFPLRFSADGTRFAVGSNPITVYSFEPK